MVLRGKAVKAARQRPHDRRHQTDSRLCQWRGSKYTTDDMNRGYDTVLCNPTWKPDLKNELRTATLVRRDGTNMVQDGWCGKKVFFITSGHRFANIYNLWPPGTRYCQACWPTACSIPVPTLYSRRYGPSEDWSSHSSTNFSASGSQDL